MKKTIASIIGLLVFSMAALAQGPPENPGPRTFVLDASVLVDIDPATEDVVQTLSGQLYHFHAESGAWELNSDHPDDCPKCDIPVVDLSFLGLDPDIYTQLPRAYGRIIISSPKAAASFAAKTGADADALMYGVRVHDPRTYGGSVLQTVEEGRIWRVVMGPAE